ncbi:MAG TPA: SDR family NAD(P)-dependent oxidoreductase, partial [Chthoniobacterales bacterium]|nr:SDR family NAD(P)-dependent oxidoreductase [Chthoniobacterales bacterium]
MKRYLITGASRGIGRAIAEKLAGPDHTLLLHGRDRGALAKTCQSAEAKSAKTIALCFDLRDPHGIQEMAKEIGTSPLDGLIHNAGIAFVKPLDAITLEEWQATIAVNVTAPFLLTQKLLTLMSAGSTIVNILSIAAKTGFPNWSSYCMSKFALEGFSQAVREEVRPRGIRVLNIYPAATSTEIWKGIEGEWPREKMLSADQVGEAVAFAL